MPVPSLQVQQIMAEVAGMKAAPPGSQQRTCNTEAVLSACLKVTSRACFPVAPASAVVLAC
jgi:hypothetical protein